jgi:hypothetical protein
VRAAAAILGRLSPATYTLSACRKLIGSKRRFDTRSFGWRATLIITNELAILALMGLVLMPLGHGCLAESGSGPSSEAS